MGERDTRSGDTEDESSRSGSDVSRRGVLASLVGVAATTTLLSRDGQATAGTDLDGRSWSVTWRDEFDGESLDTDVWTDQTGNGDAYHNPGWGNEELQYYSPDNRWVADEGLVLEAREETVSDQWGTYDYTSGKLVTAGAKSTRYGRIDVRARMPEGQGIWPAIWMLPEGDTAWPDDGEIDVMEYLGHQPATVHGTVHGPGFSGADGVSGTYRLDSGTFADDFHVFSIVWDPDRIRWYVDGEPYHAVTKTEVEDERDATWPFDDHRFHLILNVAVGGVWPGAPDETTEFPQRMTVDYVRFYEEADTQGPPPVTGEDRPTDPDEDGDYEDVNGNGRVDYDDVVEYYRNRENPVLTDHTQYYDYNDNDRIDYNDVVELYKER